jgi:hypothetical protein
MDCVLGYHMNPLTCGVAKFNAVLARRLSVTVLSLFDPRALEVERPLLSIKLSEFSEADVADLARLLDTAPWRKSFVLFLHAWSGTPIERRLAERSEIIYCVNTELVEELRPLRGDVQEAWCPSTLLDLQRFEARDVSVFSFGMAHKVRSDHYRRLHALLEETGRSYCLYLSTALHENTGFGDSFAGVFAELEAIFGDRVYFLGFLSDAAVFNYLLDTTYFAAFFDVGVRANNTSVNAAMACGSIVVTNLERHSPAAFVHGVNVLDIHQCRALPTDPRELERIGGRARATVTDSLGWDRLLEKIASGTAPGADGIVRLAQGETR